MKKTITALVAALAMSSAVQAAGPLDGYAQGGFVDASGLDDGIALKFGADFNKNLNGVKGLGLTAFYSYWSADTSEEVFGFKTSAEVTAHTFALGPTFDLPLPNTKLTLQGRAFGMITLAKAEACAGGFCSSASDSEFDIGIGFGGAYKLENNLSVRVDYDMLDGADILTAGVGFKF